MAQKVARVNWNRGQYSDVFWSAIIDPSPLKQGQKVTVIWGKSRKEYTAVVGCYPVKQGVQSGNQESELAPRRAKAKLILVSVCFSSARVLKQLLCTKLRYQKQRGECPRVAKSVSLMNSLGFVDLCGK